MMNLHKLQRLYIPEILQIGKILELDKEKSHYIAKVLRKKESDMLKIFNEKNGEFLSYIEKIGNKVEIKISEKIKEIPEKKTKICALLPLVKGDKFDIMVDMAVQTGVDEIIPVTTLYTQKRDVNYERISRIILEAAEQSDRLTIPFLHKIHKINEIEKLNFEILIWGAEREKNVTKILQNQSLQTKIKNSSLIAVFIGPEGGFSPDEKEFLKKKENFYPVSLCENILRSETAMIFLLSQIIGVNENFTNL